MSGIGLDGMESRGQGGDQADVLADDAAEHFFGIADDVVEIENLGFEDLFPAECEELASEESRLLPGFLNFFEEFALWRGEFGILEQNLGIAIDDGE